MTITLFSWGYRGWGTSTPQLVKAVDAVEQAHGFRPPVFVGIRFSRSVRAPGFAGNHEFPTWPKTPALPWPRRWA